MSDENIPENIPALDPLLIEQISLALGDGLEDQLPDAVPDRYVDWIDTERLAHCAIRGIIGARCTIIHLPDPDSQRYDGDDHETADRLSWDREPYEVSVWDADEIQVGYCGTNAEPIGAKYAISLAAALIAAAFEAARTWRDKWILRLYELLALGECLNAEDQLTVIAKIARTADLLDVDAVTDTQLRTVVNQLNKWSKAGELGSQITDILNTAAIAEAEAEVDPHEGALQ